VLFNPYLSLHSTTLKLLVVPLCATVFVYKAVSSSHKIKLRWNLQIIPQNDHFCNMAAGRAGDNILLSRRIDLDLDRLLIWIDHLFSFIYVKKSNVFTAINGKMCRLKDCNLKVMAKYIALFNSVIIELSCSRY
jgi:hypothetical protein